MLITVKVIKRHINMLELNKIYNMDCIEGMKLIEDNSIDSIVTDPPYGLGFMGKEWDTYDRTQFGLKGNEGENDLKVKKNFEVLPRYRSDNSFYEFSYAWAKEAFRVLKPGGYLLSFGGTRTYHRMASAIEDAGFEIRDMINWVYGSGFPKSLNVGKAIDKLQGNEREVISEGISGAKETHNTYNMKFEEGKTTSLMGGKYNITKGTSDFEGWGTALKPAHEPIVVARKPLSEKSVAENVLKYGTGGINIDESRIGTESIFTCGGKKGGVAFRDWKEKINEFHNGRFPANLIHDGSPEVLQEFEKAGVSSPGHWANTKVTGFGKFGNGKSEYFGVGRKCEAGTPARFFKSCEFEIEDAPSFIYTAKASKSERNDGCESKNIHPTVKPLKLIEYLTKLVTPKNGVCLDPFMGSGTTAVACVNNNFKYIGFEKEEEYVRICEARLKGKEGQERLF